MGDCIAKLFETQMTIEHLERDLRFKPKAALREELKRFAEW